MTSIWTATDLLASEMANGPLLKTFRDGLAPKPADMSQPFAVGSVHDFLVMSYSMLQSQPLLLGLRLGRIPDFDPLYHGSEEIRRWYEVAKRFASAFVEIIEFLRSRLPGYPGLLVPELVPGSPLVWHDGFWVGRSPWITEVRRAGLQLQSHPVTPPRALGLSDGGKRLNSALSDLLDELRTSAPWQRFKAADSELGLTGRDAAKRLRRDYRNAVKDERVDEIGGPTGMRSRTMRSAEMAAVKAMADGAVREYFDAFEAVDALLDAVAAFITHRIARGDIHEVRVTTAEWGPAGELRALRMTADVDDFHIPRELVRAPSSIAALDGVVLLGGLTFSMPLGQEQIAAEGHLLSGSGDIRSHGP